jgi:hypothetical protein
MDYLHELRDKIMVLHGCDATHVKTVPVKEVFQCKTIWDGEVEVFALSGYPNVGHCYAWGYPNEKQPYKLDVVAVLEIPPVVSAETAVKTAIAGRLKAGS